MHYLIGLELFFFLNYNVWLFLFQNFMGPGWIVWPWHQFEVKQISADKVLSSNKNIKWVSFFEQQGWQKLGKYKKINKRLIWSCAHNWIIDYFGYEKRTCNTHIDGPTKKRTDDQSEMYLFLFVTIVFWKGHSVARYICSLAPLTRSASLRSLCSLAPFTGSLTHFAHSLVGRLKFMNLWSRWSRVSREQTRFLSSLDTRPECVSLKIQ